MSGTYQLTSSSPNTTTIMINTPLPATTKPTDTGAIPKTKKSKNKIPRNPPPTIESFWPSIMNTVRSIQQVDAKHQALPLARIKKIMKLDENSKMIAAEAPLLFAKACEYFIQELTMRAWIHTEENKRRTLQRTDIAQAIANYDQFDFLIDIVPREEIRFQPTSQKEKKAAHVCHHDSPQTTTTVTQTQQQFQHQPASSTSCAIIKTESSPEIIQYGQVVNAIDLQQAQQQQAQQPQQIHTTTTQLPQQVQIIQQPAQLQQPLQQYYITMAGQQPGQQQIVQQFQLQPHQIAGNLQPQIAGLNLVAAQQQQPQQLIITAGPNGQLTATPAPTNATAQVQQQQVLLHNLAAQQQQQQQQQQAQPTQQIQVLQQVMTPSGEITNVPISINANQLNTLRLHMQQQQQQQQQQPQQVSIFFNQQGGAQLTTDQQQQQGATNYRSNC